MLLCKSFCLFAFHLGFFVFLLLQGWGSRESVLGYIHRGGPVKRSAVVAAARLWGRDCAQRRCAQSCRSCSLLLIFLTLRLRFLHPLAIGLTSRAPDVRRKPSSPGSPPPPPLRHSIPSSSGLSPHCAAIGLVQHRPEQHQMFALCSPTGRRAVRSGLQGRCSFLSLKPLGPSASFLSLPRLIPPLLPPSLSPPSCSYVLFL